jgi:hypothetical protein
MALPLNREDAGIRQRACGVRNYEKSVFRPIDPVFPYSTHKQKIKIADSAISKQPQRNSETMEDNRTHAIESLS